MGVIQGSINNLLMTAGVAARLSPGLEKLNKERELKKGIQNLERAREEAVEQKIGEQLQEPIAEELVKKQRELAYLNPKKSNIKEWGDEEEGLQEIKETTRKEEEEKNLTKVGKETQARIYAAAAAQETLLAKQEEKRISESFRNWRNL